MKTSRRCKWEPCRCTASGGNLRTCCNELSVNIQDAICCRYLLVVAFELLGLMCALLIGVVFKWAVVQSVGVWLHILVEGVVAGISLVGLAASRQHAV
jgi:hypothetical protein